MAAMADISVKKADGTTSIIWSGISASGGDTAPAVWRSNTATGTTGQKPVFSVTSRNNGDKSVRRIDISASFPEVYTDTTSSLTKISSKCTMTASFAVPQSLSSTTMNEFAAQVANMVASTLVVGSISSGYAPT